MILKKTSLSSKEEYTYIQCIHVHVLVNEKRSLAFNFLLPGLNKPSLGQHCFIKSIQTEPEVS